MVRLTLYRLLAAIAAGIRCPGFNLSRAQTVPGILRPLSDDVKPLSRFGLRPNAAVGQRSPPASNARTVWGCLRAANPRVEPRFLPPERAQALLRRRHVLVRDRVRAPGVRGVLASWPAGS